MTKDASESYFNRKPDYLLLRDLYANAAVDWMILEEFRNFVVSGAVSQEQLDALIDGTHGWTGEFVILEKILRLTRYESVDDDVLSLLSNGHARKLETLKRLSENVRDHEITNEDLDLIDKLRKPVESDAALQQLRQLFHTHQVTAEQLDGILKIFEANQSEDLAMDLFRGFLVDVVLTHPEEVAHLENYEPPSGKLDAKVVHILEWPPESKKEALKPFSRIADDTSNASIKFIQGSYPDWRRDFWFDWFPKRLPMPPTGQKQDVETMLKNQPAQRKCLELNVQYIKHLCYKAESTERPVINIWSHWVRREFENNFDSGSLLPIGSYKYTIFKLNHPAYLHRYAGRETLLGHVRLCERQTREHGLRTDTREMNEWANNRPENDTISNGEYPYERNAGLCKTRNSHTKGSTACQPSKVKHSVNDREESIAAVCVGIRTEDDQDESRTIVTQAQRSAMAYKRKAIDPPTSDNADANEEPKAKKTKLTAPTDKVHTLSRCFDTSAILMQSKVARCRCLSRVDTNSANRGMPTEGDRKHCIMTEAQDIRENLAHMIPDDANCHAQLLASMVGVKGSKPILHLTPSRFQMKVNRPPKTDQHSINIIDVASQLVAGIQRSVPLSIGHYGPFQYSKKRKSKVRRPKRARGRGFFSIASILGLPEAKESSGHKIWLPIVSVELPRSLRRELEFRLSDDGCNSSCFSAGLFRHFVFALHEGIGVLNSHPDVPCIALTSDGRWCHKTAEDEKIFPNKVLLASDDPVTSSSSPAVDQDTQAVNSADVDEAIQAGNDDDIANYDLLSQDDDASYVSAEHDLRVSVDHPTREELSHVQQLKLSLENQLHPLSVDITREYIVEGDTQASGQKAIITVGRSMPHAELYDKIEDARIAPDQADIVVSAIRCARYNLPPNFHLREPPINPTDKMVKFGPLISRDLSKNRKDILEKLKAKHVSTKKAAAKEPLSGLALHYIACRYKDKVMTSGVLPTHWVMVNGKAHFKWLTAVKTGDYAAVKPLSYSIAQATALLAADLEIRQVRFLINKTWELTRADGTVRAFRFKGCEEREIKILNTMLYTISKEEIQRRQIERAEAEVAARKEDEAREKAEADRKAVAEAAKMVSTPSEAPAAEAPEGLEAGKAEPSGDVEEAAVGANGRPVTYVDGTRELLSSRRSSLPPGDKDVSPAQDGTENNLE